MKKVKKLVALTVMATLTLSMGVFTGCGSSSTKTDEKVTVDIFQFKVEAKDALESAVKEYEDKNPNVTINVETVGGGSDYGAALRTKFSSGEEPTIFNIGGTQDAIDWKTKLEDLSDQPWKSQAYDGTLDAVTADGKLSGMPFSQEGYGYIYNKEIFKKAGIDASTIKSFSDLEKAFATLDSKKKELGLDSVLVLPGKETWVTGLHLSNTAFANEFKSAKEASEAKTIDFKYGDALQKMVDLQVKYALKPDGTNGSINGVDYSTQVEKEFSLKKCAVIQQGNWVYGTIKGIDPELAKNIGILPMPVDGAKDGSIPVGVPMYWSVNSTKTDAEKKAAKDFLNWLYTSDEGKTRIVNDFNFIPAFKGYDADNLKPQDPLAQDIIKYCNEGKTMPWVFMGYPSGWGQNNLGASLQKYFSGESTWAQVVDDSKKSWSESRSK